jgi:crotonobetainyl-CoA:carnitine CoA-transferase CaiB-like acyl-CoA transferase
MPGAALEGVLVVTLEQAVAAPFCTSRLADAGARVIKIERGSGDLARKYDEVAHGESAYFVWLNRGKQSLTLDIKQPDAAALLKRMVNKADVFVQNLAPGAAERAGFGAAALRAQNPRLIVCDITGYGDSGPYAEMKAYDLLIQCETGLASITGGPEAPGRVGVSVADIGCGMYAHAAILQALFAREHSGEGCRISVSLFDGIADWMAVPLIQREYTGQEPKRLGLAHASIAPYGAYRAGDGAQFIIAVQTEAEWANLCRGVLDRPDMIDDPRFASNSRRAAHRPELDAEMSAALSRFDAAAMAAALRTANIAFGRYNDVGEFAGHSQLRRAEVQTPSGPVSVPAPAPVFDGQKPALGPVPAVGEHSEAIRREFAVD